MNNSNKSKPFNPFNQLKGKSKFPWGVLIWILLIFVVILFFSNVFKFQESADLSYSEFKQQVKRGNISEVTIQGQKIQGSFKKAYKPEKGETSYTSFQTVKPSVEDTELINILENSGVNIHAKEENRTWLPTLLIFLLPWALLIGYFVFMRKRMQNQMKKFGGGGGGFFNIGKSKARRYRKTSSKETFNDVAGLENPKRDLKEIVQYLKNPNKFKELGADIPKGLLLVGPPGSGKTLLARACAGEADVPFFSISGSEFIEMFVGVGASRVRDMFSTAKREAPSIIFIDELDSIGRARGTGLGGGHDEREQTLNQILAEMDGFAPHESVIVLSATNRPDVLDTALTRPGRFDRQISLDLPEKKAREKILRIHTRKVPLKKDVDIQNIAARTVGFSGADLKNLVNEAALLAGRKNKKKVSFGEFDQARDKILLGHEREDIISEEEKKIIAYHEGGHALMAKLTPRTDPVQKVTIIPRGRSLGATEQTPEEDRHNLKKDYLLNRIAVMLGGRAAEKIKFKDVSNGAYNDLKQVTDLARRMVTQWGMSDRVGPVTFSLGEQHLFLGREMAQPKEFSEETARIIDEEIQKIVGDMENKAIKTLNENKDKLDRLAQGLLENETLEDKDIDRILS
ncbi:ATP-dependent zinc metalloprotease FtsH [bacterium]|nr:ATP-dependent zinc metalloprotease FtsH [bacterium]